MSHALFLILSFQFSIKVYADFGLLPAEEILFDCPDYQDLELCYIPSYNEIEAEIISFQETMQVRQNYIRGVKAKINNIWFEVYAGMKDEDQGTLFQKFIEETYVSLGQSFKIFLSNNQKLFSSQSSYLVLLEKMKVEALNYEQLLNVENNNATKEILLKNKNMKNEFENSLSLFYFRFLNIQKNIYQYPDNFMMTDQAIYKINLNKYINIEDNCSGNEELVFREIGIFKKVQERSFYSSDKKYLTLVDDLKILRKVLNGREESSFRPLTIKCELVTNENDHPGIYYDEYENTLVNQYTVKKGFFIWNETTYKYGGYLIDLIHVLRSYAQVP